VSARQRRVRIDIGRLILRGFCESDRTAVSGAFEATLQQALAAPGALEQLGGNRSVAPLQAVRVRVPAGATPARVAVLAATQLARRVTG
jgi:hypothetical protein